MSRSRESVQELGHGSCVVCAWPRNVRSEEVLKRLACSPAKKRSHPKPQGDATCGEKEAFHEKGRGMEEMCRG